MQRLKKKLCASFTTTASGDGLRRIPSDRLRGSTPQQFFGAKELFGGLVKASSQPPTQSQTPLRRPIIHPPQIHSTREEIVSLQKNVASLAAAAALQRNISVRAKEIIIDGLGSGDNGEKEHVASRLVTTTSSSSLPKSTSLSVQTQTEPLGGGGSGACPWWMVLETPYWWRQSSMSFSAATSSSSGVGVDDGSNFQDDFSTV